MKFTLFKSFLHGLKIALVVLAVTALIAFLSAPTFLGLAIITGTAASAVLFWTVFAFVITSVWRFMKKDTDAKSGN